MKRRLVVISPCRDEERFVRLTLDSVVKQTYRPDLWIIVDDGSRDQTAAIVAQCADQHPWIRLVQRQRGGVRQLGPGVVSAFNAGLAYLGDTPFDVIAKLDTDTEFGAGAFATIMTHFDDLRVGMASGNTYLLTGDKLVFDATPPIMSQATPNFTAGNVSRISADCNRSTAGMSSTKPMPAATAGSP